MVGDGGQIEFNKRKPSGLSTTDGHGGLLWVENGMMDRKTTNERKLWK
jgi:hypothetical protein